MSATPDDRPLTLPAAPRSGPSLSRDRERCEARLSVDLDALGANYALLLKEARGAEIAPVVKADAYGLGAAEIAARLHIDGARSFFVARVAEGEALRAALRTRPAAIYVLDGAPPGAARRLQAADLTPVLNSLAQAEEWSAHARGGPLSPAALHVDTGMNRLGLTLPEAEALAAAPGRLDRLKIELVMSHLACAEDVGSPMNARQQTAFRHIRGLFPDARASLANSAGVFLGDDYLFSMARPGITLYGGGPRGRVDARVRAVATLEAPILQVRDAIVGQTVGYGGVYKVERPMHIAVLAAGYADGYLRTGSPAGYAVLRGHRCALLGRVSMDLIAIDVTEVSAAAGDLVQLLGPELPLDEAAAAAGTIAYELLVRLSSRAARRYVGRPG